MAQSFEIAPKDIRYVAFQGGADALASLLGGHVAAFVGDAGEIASHSEAGTVVPLATLSPSASMEFTKIRPRLKKRAWMSYPETGAGSMLRRKCPRP